MISRPLQGEERHGRWQNLDGVELLSPWVGRASNTALMELNDLTTVSDELRFCETGNRLALVFPEHVTGCREAGICRVRSGRLVSCLFDAQCIALACCQLSRL